MQDSLWPQWGYLPFWQQLLGFSISAFANTILQSKYGNLIFSRKGTGHICLSTMPDLFVKHTRLVDNTNPKWRAEGTEEHTRPSPWRSGSSQLQSLQTNLLAASHKQSALQQLSKMGTCIQAVMMAWVLRQSSCSYQIYSFIFQNGAYIPHRLQTSLCLSFTLLWAVSYPIPNHSKLSRMSFFSILNYKCSFILVFL